MTAVATGFATSWKADTLICSHSEFQDSKRVLENEMASFFRANGQLGGRDRARLDPCGSEIISISHLTNVVH
jgi:hypothetical protein